MSNSVIPASWCLTSVGEVSELIAGSGFPKEQQGNSEGDYPFAKVGDISRAFRSGKQFISSADHYISEEVRCELKARIFPKGSIVFPKIGEALKGNYRVITARPMLFDNNVMGVAPDERIIEQKYLFYFLSTQDFGRFAVATAVPSVRGGDIASIPLRLPPLLEQHRIVGKIEELFSELDKGVESLTTALEQLKAYRQSVLKAAFEGALTEGWRRLQQNLPAACAIVAGARTEKRKTGRGLPKDDTVVPPTVPSEWGTIALGDLSVDVFDGPFGSNLKTSDYVDSGVRVIRLENIGHGKFIEEKRSYVSMEKYEDLKRHTVVPGDIVVSSFVTDAIRSAMVPASVTVSINKADCFAVRFRGDAMISEFAQRFLESRCAYKQVEGMIHGVGRPRINTTQLKQLILPICSRAEQIELLSAISSAYSEVDALDAELTAQLEKANALRQSILKRAFSGQLVAQDSADEPTSELLKSIRAEREESGSTKRRNNKNGKKEAA